MEPNVAVEFNDELIVDIGHCTRFGHDGVFTFDFEIAFITRNQKVSTLMVCDRTLQSLVATNHCMVENMYSVMGVFRSLISGGDYDALVEI